MNHPTQSGLSEESITRGTSFLAKPEFLLIFLLGFLMLGVGIVATLVAKATGWITVGSIALIGAAAYFSGLGEKLLVLIVALIGLVGGLVGIGVVNVMLLGQQSLNSTLLLAVIDVMALAGVGSAVALAFRSDAGPGEQLLSVVVAIASTLFLLTSVVVVAIAMAELGLLVRLGVIVAFTLATLGWAVMKGMRG